jgi:hypothetical protein
MPSGPNTDMPSFPINWFNWDNCWRGTSCGVFWAGVLAFYWTGWRKPPEISVRLACLQVEVKTYGQNTKPESIHSFLTFGSLAWFKSKFVLRRWIISTYTPSAMGRRVRHRQLVTQTVTSSLDSIFNILPVFIHRCEIQTYLPQDFSSVRLLTQGMTPWFVG